MKSCAAVVTLGVVTLVAGAQTAMLPDIIVDPNRLFDNSIEVSGGRRYLRLSNGTANLGPGKFQIYGGMDNGDGTQEVIQRVFNDDGTYEDRVAGLFVFHPTHNHIHVEDWAEYRLREVLPDDGVGDVVAFGDKTSFCIVDLGVYDPGVPNYNPSGEFFSCGSTIQGLSVGWVDVYSRHLDGQEIDITDVEPGEYWLESVVDPDNNFLEANEDNNTALIKVTIPPSDGTGGELNPDAYEPNDSQAETTARPVGLAASPNLGPAGPSLTLEDLSIDASGDDDYYRFYMPATGTSDDFVRITFSHAEGDLDMRLYNDSGAQIGASEGTSNAETISLSGRPAGWYVVRAYGWNGATSSHYDLTIDPASNGTPSVTPIDPPAGNTNVHHGTESYTVKWDATDPESNLTWVNVYLNTTPTLDGNEYLLPTSANTPGDSGFYVVNTSDVSPDTYWVYFEITDGGTVSGAWSPGTLSLLNPCNPADINADGLLNNTDINAFVNAFLASEPIADINTDGNFNNTDINAFVNAFLAGCN